MRLSEIYTSIQGEGPNTGKPTTFVRFGGCNLRCPGWGSGTLPDGTIVQGCDTVFAVYPEWRSTWNSLQPYEIADMISESPKRVCLTGGEPLIQPSVAMTTLVGMLTHKKYEIDLFTNGSRLLPSWGANHNVCVVMDYKLPGSGEFGSFDIRNLQRLGGKDAIKFVCKDRADFETALSVIQHNGFVAQVWFGVVWSELEHSVLADWIHSEYPEGRMNVQTHKLIWDPEERRR